MKRLRGLTVPFAGVLVVLAMACSGGGDGSGDSAGYDAGNSGSSGSDGGNYLANNSGPTGGGSTTSQVLDLTRAAQELQAVNSFRFDMTFSMDFDLPEGGSADDQLGAALMGMFSDIGAEGAYVGPDSYEMSMELFGEEFKMVQIGDEAWVYESGQWTAVGAGDISSFTMGMSGSPTDLPFEFLPEEVLSGAEVSSEHVNGVDATRYSFDKDSLIALAEQFGEEMDMPGMDEIDTLELDVWLTDGYFPVKMTMRVHAEAEGSQIGLLMDFNVTDINDGGIEIKRPI